MKTLTTHILLHNVLLHNILLRNVLLLNILLFGLIGCAGKEELPATKTDTTIDDQDGPPIEYVDVSKIANAIPKKTVRSRYGNPSSYEVFGKRYYVMPSYINYKEKGIASWYGSKFHGRRTSSGEPYNMHAMTAAHKSLSLPTYVKVTNLKNNRQVILKVNDRGPFHENRIIDLSHTAAVKLGIKAHGTGWVEVEAINPGQKVSTSSRAPQRAKAIALYVQLGVFSRSENAQQFTKKMRSLLSRAIHINKKWTDNQPLYHVRIGPLSNTAQVDKLITNLSQKGVVQHHIIIE